MMGPGLARGTERLEGVGMVSGISWKCEREKCHLLEIEGGNSA